LNGDNVSVDCSVDIFSSDDEVRTAVGAGIGDGCFEKVVRGYSYYARMEGLRLDSCLDSGRGVVLLLEG
jgi:hypothetical protein